MTSGRTRTILWRICCASLPLLLSVSAPEREALGAERAIRIEVELLDSVRCWCSPLWGHHAPKIVEGRNGEIFVALFSGEYPEANVQILKRTSAGLWQRGKVFRAAYQPSFMFVDGSGRLNVLQNSQTKTLIQFRSTDDNNLENFEKVAEGNGQSDGRGWYVGAGVRGDTVYMAYILLSYDLYLTWKPVRDTVWNHPVLIHKGSLDAAKGNHSWTRPRFQFAGRKGFFVVNETSDGSVRNTYNAVQLVTFDLGDPTKFAAECITRVPQGFGAYSSDFSVSEDGTLQCIVEKSPRLYDSPFTSDASPGVYVYSRPISSGAWSSALVFRSPGYDASFLNSDQRVTIVRVRSTDSIPAVKQYGKEVTAPGSSWEAAQSDDHGVTWEPVAVVSPCIDFTRPSHIQSVTGANSWRVSRNTQGIFEDQRGPVPGSRLSRYGVYYFRIIKGGSL